ncbi:MAG: hypothetical protein P1P90_03910 [Patescibacteria group bacterium]|nr:hypothetical protein [Patescibacteria group bacterium]
MQSTFQESPRLLTLKHDFRFRETPAAIFELTPDLLRELFDQAIHYGFPDAPLSPNKSIFLRVNNQTIKVTASLDADFLMMCIGSSRNKPFYLFTLSGLIYWESRLRVSNILEASSALDTAMEQRGFYNRAEHKRTNLLEAKGFRVEEVFAKPRSNYTLPKGWNIEISEIFDRPELLAVLHLYGRDVVCKREDADAIRELYKPLTAEAITESNRRVLQGMRAQADKSRYS